MPAIFTAKKGLQLGLMAMVALFASAAAEAIEVTRGVKVDLQLRSRFFRNDGHDGNMSNTARQYVDNRARLGVDIDVIPFFRGFLQLQDVRLWGEEADTVFDFTANGLDLHQAYGDLRLLKKRLLLRIGRQEIALDGQRLVGAVAWTPQARSFDALRVIARPRKGMKVDAFFALLSDRDNQFPFAPSQVNVNTSDAFLGGIHVSQYFFKKKCASQYLSAVSLFEHYSDTRMDRYTLGLYNRGRHGALSYRVEGYYQGGSAGNSDISAFMFGVKAGVRLRKLFNLNISGVFDFLSGDDDPTDQKVKAFQIPFGTNHKFYGMADFFLNNAAHTNQQGLMDLGAQVSVKPAKMLKLILHYHHFMAASTRGGPATFGDELDFLAVFKLLKHFKVVVELFVMLPGDLLKAKMGGTDPDIGFIVTTLFNL